MSVKSLNLADVAKLTDAEREQVFAEFLSPTGSLNGEIEELDRRIASFERVYEISTETMLRELNSGVRKETAEIGHWLMLLELKNRVQQHAC